MAGFSSLVKRLPPFLNMAIIRTLHLMAGSSSLVNMLSGLRYRLQKAALALQLGRNPARVNTRYNALSDAQKVRFYKSYSKLFHSALV